MKKYISFVCFFLMLCISTNAQIKRSKIAVNKSKVNTTKQVKGAKINVSKLKSINNFKTLNIPVMHISKEKLNAKPINTWKITPLKPKHAHLELKSLFGIVTPSHWQTGIEVKNYNSNFSDLNTAFPLSIKFRVTGGVEYRLKLKDLIRNRSGYVYIAIQNIDGQHYYVNRVEFDRNNELYYSFYEENSKNIIINVSFLSTSSPSNAPNTECLKFSEIEISRITKTE